MATYRTTINTPMSPAETFSYLADITDFADWDPGVLAARQVMGEGPGPGAVYDLDVHMAGRKATLRYVVTEYDDSRTIRLRAENKLLSSDDAIRVAPVGDGAAVTYEADLSLRGALRPLEPFLQKAFDRIGDRAADGLAKALSGDRLGAVSRP